jgi:DNA-binding response OmpR family regulator
MRTQPRIEDPQLEVMFVEQDRDLADMYRLKLELDGYRVTTVRSGDAVDQARRRPPDLVFIDLASDSQEGLAVLRRMRARIGREQLPAVVLTGMGRAELEARGLDLGPCDYAVRVTPAGASLEAWPISA